jgi:hypothetical protein
LIERGSIQVLGLPFALLESSRRRDIIVVNGGTSQRSP